MCKSAHVNVRLTYSNTPRQDVVSIKGNGQPKNKVFLLFGASPVCLDLYSQFAYSIEGLRVLQVICLWTCGFSACQLNLRNAVSKQLACNDDESMQLGKVRA